MLIALEIFLWWQFCSKMIMLCGDMHWTESANNFPCYLNSSGRCGTAGTVPCHSWPPRGARCNDAEVVTTTSPLAAHQNCRHHLPWLGHGTVSGLSRADFSCSTWHTVVSRLQRSSWSLVGMRIHIFLWLEVYLIHIGWWVMFCCCSQYIDRVHADVSPPIWANEVKQSIYVRTISFFLQHLMS